jgi:hypothetical protein
MTKAAKITYLAALFFGLSIGAFFGFGYRSGVLDLHQSFRQMRAVDALGHFSYLQYKHADPGHAAAALQTFANMLEDMEKSKPEQEHRYDLVNTYTRLALLADAANNPEQSRTYMAKAKSWDKAAGGGDLSDSQMKSAVKAKDEMYESLLMD